MSMCVLNRGFPQHRGAAMQKPRPLSRRPQSGLTFQHSSQEQKTEGERERELGEGMWYREDRETPGAGSPYSTREGPASVAFRRLD